MLGNHADAFFTTPMRTSIVSGNTRAARAGEMPAPFGGGSATKQITVKSGLPFGGEMLPGVGAEDPAAAIAADTKKFLGMSLPVLGLALGAAFLFLTEPGARIRSKIGF
jgi:hypothetical protein